MSGQEPVRFVRREPWMHQGACRGLGELMFADEVSKHVTQDHAKAVCRACPVLSECTEWALWSGECADFGVAAAMSPTERMMRRRAARATRLPPLTVAQSEVIRARYADGGVSRRELAAEYGVSVSWIDRITAGQQKRPLLSAAQVDEIRARYAEGGTSYRLLAVEFGVSKETICDVVRRWRRVEERGIPTG